MEQPSKPHHVLGAHQSRQESVAMRVFIFQTIFSALQSGSKLIVSEMRSQIKRGMVPIKLNIFGAPSNKHGFYGRHVLFSPRMGMNMAISFSLHARCGAIKCVLVATKRAKHQRHRNGPRLSTPV